MRRTLFTPPHTRTTISQSTTEMEIEPFYKILLDDLPADQLEKLRDQGLVSPTSTKVRLLREKHKNYVLDGLTKPLSPGYVSLDSSRPWLIYWCLHSLSLLGYDAGTIGERVVHTLSSFQNNISKPEDKNSYRSTGGFGGGEGQISHGAPTYASVLSLLIVGTKQAYDSIDRAALYSWYLSMKDKSTGGFAMHDDGETDVRGTYCALVVCKILNLLTEKITRGCKEYMLDAYCNYQGGFGAEGGNEPHGGYTFCAVAGLWVLGEFGNKDLNECWGECTRDWLAMRQMTFEGGFNGRSGKLVDNCYSFWIGGTWAVLALGEGQNSSEDDYENVGDGDDSDNNDVIDIGSHGSEIDINSSTANSKARLAPIEITATNEQQTVFNSYALQRYILLCGQAANGGLRDKPSKNRDHYHTCYSLSGLSVAQWAEVKGNTGAEVGRPYVYGDAEYNLLERTHPVYNVKWSMIERAEEYFKSKPAVKPTVVVCDNYIIIVLPKWLTLVPNQIIQLLELFFEGCGPLHSVGSSKLGVGHCRFGQCLIPKQYKRVSPTLLDDDLCSVLPTVLVECPLHPALNILDILGVYPGQTRNEELTGMQTAIATQNLFALYILNQ